MLKGIRKNTKLIIWTVITAFVLWGGFSVGTQFQKKGRIAGEVFGKDITFQEYNLFYKSQQMFSYAGNQPPTDAETLRQQAWESLILSKEAKRQKIQVTDEEVRNEILRLLAQQKIVNPDIRAYERWLQTTIRETAKDFEFQIRELLRIQKILQKIRNQAVPPAAKDSSQKEFREVNQFSAEIANFKTLKDANDFIAKVKKPEDWEKEIKAGKLETKSSGLLPISSWIEVWGIPERETLELLQAEKGAVRGPVHANNVFSVFKIVDKKQATPEEINNRKFYEAFLAWRKNVFEKARLKDYTAN